MKKTALILVTVLFTSSVYAGGNMSSDHCSSRSTAGLNAKTAAKTDTKSASTAQSSTSTKMTK